MKRLKDILSRVLEIDAQSITDETSPDSVSTWDSFNSLLLVCELENAFKVKFTMEEVTKVKCVRDIKETLGRHGVQLKEDKYA